jgi:hypothetical protein
MKRFGILVALLVLACAGCSSIERPSWLASADFLTEPHQEFFKVDGDSK